MKVYGEKGGVAILGKEFPLIAGRGGALNREEGPDHDAFRQASRTRRPFSVEKHPISHSHITRMECGRRERGGGLVGVSTSPPPTGLQPTPNLPQQKPQSRCKCQTTGKASAGCEVTEEDEPHEGQLQGQLRRGQRARPSDETSRNHTFEPRGGELRKYSVRTVFSVKKIVTKGFNSNLRSNSTHETLP